MMAAPMGKVRRTALRRYPPAALALTLACLLAATILPSSLNTLSNNPSATPEYAPVSTGDKNAPPGGNVASLGLGRSGSVGSASGGTAASGGAGTAEPTPPTQPTGGSGRRPTQFRCVGTPPRQTEDPLAPPCSAFYDGDNGGATARGVTGDEVRVLAYVGYNNYVETGTSKPGESVQVGRYDDMDAPAKDDEYVYSRVLRPLIRYFNNRYQLYNRHAHVTVFYGSGGASTEPDVERAEANASAKQVDPFAAMAWGPGAGVDFVDGMARRGIMAFSSGEMRSDAFYQRFPGLTWGYPPTVERTAALFTSYLCKKIVPYPVSFSGNPTDDAKPRVFGLLRVREPQSMAQYSDEIRKRVEACGGQIKIEQSLRDVRYVGPQESQDASAAMAAFSSNGVTTILAPDVDNGGNHTGAGARIGYRPEWVIGHEIGGAATLQDQTAWSHAFAVTTRPRVDDVTKDLCHQAVLEASPGIDQGDMNRVCSDGVYEDLRQLFTGLQAAGPRLTTTQMERGFRAIPPKPSTTPYVPACFYEASDATCVKDATVEWWDSNVQWQGSNGCYRMVEGGQRYLVGQWPDGDATRQRKPDDPCNAKG
jgi:hypothetical protein